MVFWILFSTEGNQWLETDELQSVQEGEVRFRNRIVEFHDKMEFRFMGQC